MALSKCPECWKEVSTSAKVCPHCHCEFIRGLKAPHDPGAEETRQEEAEQCWATLRSWGAVLAVAIFIGLILSLFTGCGDSGNGAAEPQKMSKAEWRQKYSQNFGQNPIVQVAKFKAVFGEPDRSETSEQSAYFHYTCRDGEIEVIANDPNLFGKGACVQQINDY
jgi:hypothetical protein